MLSGLLQIISQNMISQNAYRIEKVIDNLEQLTEHFEASRPTGSNPDVHTIQSTQVSQISVRDSSTPVK